MAVTQRPPAFRGRSSERHALDRLLAEARGSRSGVLVVRGAAGIGKTALMRHAAEQASGFRVAQISGIEAEMELPFAALHQLCMPLLDRLEALPAPQQDALRVALGVASGAAPDRFLVGLATLTLLAEVAEEQPLLCLVDDLQWLDEASAQALGFVARRLLAERVAIVFAVREPSDPPAVAGLPELRLEGLGREDASALLDMVVPGRLDESVRERIIGARVASPAGSRSPCISTTRNGIVSPSSRPNESISTALSGWRASTANRSMSALPKLPARSAACSIGMISSGLGLGVG